MLETQLEDAPQGWKAEVEMLETSHKMVMEASQSATNSTMKQKADVDSLGNALKQEIFLLQSALEQERARASDLERQLRVLEESYESLERQTEQKSLKVAAQQLNEREASIEEVRTFMQLRIAKLEEENTAVRLLLDQAREAAKALIKERQAAIESINKELQQQKAAVLNEEHANAIMQERLLILEKEIRFEEAELDTRPETKQQLYKDRAKEMMWVMDANSQVRRVQTEYGEKCTFITPVHTHEVMVEFRQRTLLDEAVPKRCKSSV